MAAKFEPDRSGMRTYLREGEYASALMQHAQLIEARAKSTAPVESAASARRHDRVPGRFRDSIHTERHAGAKRHTVRVVADCDGAAAIEAQHRTLGRAAG